MLQLQADVSFSEFLGPLMPRVFASCVPSLLPSTHVAAMFCWCLLPLRCASKVDWDVPLAWQVLQLHFIEDVFFCSVPREGSAADFAF
jgi:hypothetical protein